MKNFKYTLIALATTFGLGINADVIEYDSYSMEQVSQLENAKFETFIVKFKNEELHKDLAKDMNGVSVSENRIYALNELTEISQVSDLLIKHDKSLPLGIDTLKIKTNGLDSNKVIESLMQTGLFEYVEKEIKAEFKGKVNRKLTFNSEVSTNDLPLGRFNDPFWSLQVHFDDREEPNMGLSNLLKNRDLIQNNINRKIKIAVLDSGSFVHEDVVFNNEGYDFTTVTGQVDENGNAITKFPDDDPTDLGLDEEGNECVSGHGLAVSGLIAATTDNSRGIVGALDTSLVDIIPVRVGTCDGNIAVSDLLLGMSWAAGLEINGIPEIREEIDIMNLSLGGAAECSEAAQTIINYAVDQGIMVVVSAGNEGGSADGVFPANCDNVITVGSLALEGDLSDFSNFGDKLSVSGIGENWVLPFVSTEERDGTEYGDWSGTSFSAPMVTAIAATVKLKYPELGVANSKELMERTASEPQISQEKEQEEGSTTDEIETELVAAPNCTEKGCGAGVIDAENVLVALDDRTKVYEGEIYHKYTGFNSLPEAKYLREIDISTGRKSCDLYIASWGILRDEFEDITHRVYTSETTQESLTSSNSTLQKIVDLPTTIIEINPNERAGVQICEGSFCGEIFELEVPKKDIPIYCENYISN